MKQLLFTGIFILSLAGLAAEPETKGQEAASASPAPEKETPPAEIAKPEAAPTDGKTKSPEKFSFFGGFRLRHQSEKVSTQDERKLVRMQAQLGVNVLVQDDLTATLRLMTGSGANSGNQTLGDTPQMARRGFGLDQAFFEYRPLSLFKLYGGKMPGPFYAVGKNQVLLDRDITPEGVAVKYQQTFGAHQVLINTGGFYLKENYDSTFGQDQSDNMFYGAQLGYRLAVDSWHLLIGGSQYGFTSLKDTSPATLMKDTAATARGNSTEATGNYANNYDIREYFAEIKGKVAFVDIGVHYAVFNNIDVDVLNKADSYGLSVGIKPVTLSFTSQKIEKDAVFALLTDSDFAGGEVSSRGTVVALSWALSSKANLTYTQWINQSAIETTTPVDYRRSHLDLGLSF